MFSRGIALSSIIALATVAQGGVEVQLVPKFCPGGTCVAGTCSGGTRNGQTCAPAQYPPNSVVQVDVNLAQAAGGADQRIRMVELDMLTTSSLLGITLPLTHDRGTPGTGDDINFWTFGSLPSCVGSPTFCGFNHYIDDDRPAGPVDTRVDMLSIAYYGLNADLQAQILLPASGAPVNVGKLQVTMPPLSGTFTLNMMNAADTGDRGARVDFGIDPHTIWRARNTAPNNVTGGSLPFAVCSTDPCPGDSTGSCCVSGNCTVTTQAGCPGVWSVGGSCTPNPCAPTCQNFASSVPIHTAVGTQVAPSQGSLWRTARNTLRMTFGGALSAAPTAAQIEIVELRDGGLFGPNVAANGFTFLLESGNTVLRIRDDDATSDLVHGKWYAIRNTGGWTAACPFEIHFPVQVGDANGDGLTAFSDLGFINTQIPTAPAADNARRDINGDASIAFSDLGAANTRVPSGLIAKPTGH